MPARSVALGLSEPWWEGVTLAKPLGPQGLPCPAPQRQPGLAASIGTGCHWASSARALPTWSRHTCPSCALGTESPRTPGLGGAVVGSLETKKANMGMSWGAWADRLGEGGLWAGGAGPGVATQLAAIKEDVSSRPLLPSKAGDP